jgi:hypothetical protein
MKCSMQNSNLPMRGSALFASYYLLRILPFQNHALCVVTTQIGNTGYDVMPRTCRDVMT